MNNQFTGLKRAIFGSLAAASLATVGALTNAGAANAIALTGEFQFSSFGRTAAFLYKNRVDFDDPGNDPVLAAINPDISTGTFQDLGFEAVFVKDISTLTNPTNNPLFDLELTVADWFDYNAQGDGKNIFNATRFTDYTFNQNGRNVSIGLGFFGEFISETGKVTKGAGNFTFQVNNSTVATVKSLIESGGTVRSTFSGGSFATAAVPEPASILGLGLVGGALVASRRKASKHS